MNAFEQIVAGLFRSNGYWTITEFKVNLTKDEKKEIGKESLPRPEIDILAYKGMTNELVWIECKSYLDSPGVRYASFFDPNDPGYGRYKVFNDERYRNVTGRRLKLQTFEQELTRENPSLSYCLVAGKVYSEKDNNDLKLYFTESGWHFFNGEWLKQALKIVADSPYEDDIATIVAKIIQRI